MGGKTYDLSCRIGGSQGALAVGGEGWLLRWGSEVCGAGGRCCCGVGMEGLGGGRGGGAEGLVGWLVYGVRSAEAMVWLWVWLRVWDLMLMLLMGWVPRFGYGVLVGICR